MSSESDKGNRTGVTNARALPSLSDSLLSRFPPPKDELDVLEMAHYVMVVKSAPAAKDHPLLRPLWEAYLIRLKQHLETPHANRGSEQLAELKEFSDSLIVQQLDWTEDHDVLAGNVWVRRGKTYGEARQLNRQIRQSRSGRTATTRGLALRGYELKLLNPALRWEDVVVEVCDCGKSSHDQFCCGRMKTAVTKLKKFLRKYDLLRVVDPQAH
jgi:hypothetical protein